MSSKGLDVKKGGSCDYAWISTVAVPRRAGSAARVRNFLLASTALVTGWSSLLGMSGSALAACVITQPNQYLFTCAQNTTTSPTSHRIIGPGTTSEQGQSAQVFGLNVVINKGVTVDGAGLRFTDDTSLFEANTINTIVNNGTVKSSLSLVPALSYSNGGINPVVYTGDGALVSQNSRALDISSFGSAVRVGSAANPVVPNFSGPEGGISIFGGNLSNGSVEVYLSGGVVNGGISLLQQGKDSAIVSLTGHTVIGGNKFVTGVGLIGRGTIGTDAIIGDAAHPVNYGISVIPFTSGGAITVTQNAGGSIFASSYGIAAGGSGPGGSLTVTNNGAISVAGGTGIWAEIDKTNSETVTVRHNGTITTSPGQFTENGIIAATAGPGNVAVGVTGNIVTSSASQATALSAAATTGSVTIDIAAGASISGGGNGIVASTTGGAVTINNLGTVSGVTAASFTGTLNVGNGGTTGTIIGNVLDRGTLNFNRSDAVEYSGIISDTGRVQQNGSGTLTLSGINTYTGTTNVNAGTLAVNGSIASSNLTTVNAGATLTGTGSVGSTVIASGGTFIPGNGTPGSSLTVAGNLAFQSGALYLVGLNPSTSTFTNVTGSAALNGGAAAAFLSGNYTAKQYTILTAAGGVNGTFGAFDTLNIPANFKSSLSYDGNNVYLNLALNFVPPPGGLNANQQSAANAIVGFFNSNGTIPLVFGGLTAPGLTQISGEVATGTQQSTFDAMGMFMGLLTDPSIAGRGDPVISSAAAPQFAEEADANADASGGKARSGSERDAYAAVYRKAPALADPFVQRWSVWAAGYGGSQTTDGNTVVGSNNTRSSIGGVAVGADYRVSPFTLAGFAIAGGATNFSVNGLGSGRSDLFQAGAFMRHNVGAAYLTGALAYGWQDITTDRTVTVAGADLLRANFNANAFSGRLEGGYRFAVPWTGGVGLTPYAAGQFITFDLPAYAEQAIAGTSTFALSYAGKRVTDPRSELGLRTDKSFAMPNGIFTLRGRAAWAHDFNTDRSIVPTFQTLPGASFVVNGAAHAADAALVTGSAEMKWLNGISLAATFEGEFSDVTRSYAGKGVARYSW